MTWLLTILTSVLGSVVKQVREWFSLWFAQKTAEENAWAAKTGAAMLRSIKDTDKVNASVRNAGLTVKPPADPAAWNKAAPLLLLPLLLCLTGCWTNYVYVESKWPVLEAPARPAVSTEPAVWTERERVISGYAAQLEAVIGQYNVEAKSHNDKNGY